MFYLWSEHQCTHTCKGMFFLIKISIYLLRCFSQMYIKVLLHVVCFLSSYTLIRYLSGYIVNVVVKYIGQNQCPSNTASVKKKEKEQGKNTPELLCSFIHLANTLNSYCLLFSRFFSILFFALQSCLFKRFLSGSLLSIKGFQLYVNDTNIHFLIKKEAFL